MRTLRRHESTLEDLGPSLTAQERWAAILDVIGTTGRLEVDATARQLGVSSATVRRDLDELARQQLLMRTRGGAVAHRVSYDLPLRYKTAKHAPEKHWIGQKVAKMVTAGAVVGLNGGTTTAEVARALAARDAESPNGEAAARLTVVTNALNIANELAVWPQIKLVVTGGVARPQSFELIGPLATAVLAEVSLDYAVLGVDGLDVAFGATCIEEGEAAISQLMVARARQVIVAADASKLGRHTFARICGLDKVDILVTSPGADKATIKSISDAGVHIEGATA